ARDGTKLKKAPLVEPDARLLEYSRELDALGQRQSTSTAKSVLQSDCWTTAQALRAALETTLSERKERLGRMVALQEELDWHVYECFGLIAKGQAGCVDLDRVTPLELGHRPFEIVLAQRVAESAGEFTTTWFERHGSTPTVQVPSLYSAGVRRRLEARLRIISETRVVALIEQPEYKRRWQSPDFTKETTEAIEAFLLDAAEDWVRSRPSAVPVTVARLARALETEPRALAAAEVLVGRPDFDLVQLLDRLVAQDAVPTNRFHRYSPAGLKKHAAWERAWALQRAADRGEKVGEMSVPPKYTTKDFKRSSIWRLRGKLDVPKERFLEFAEAPSAQGEARFGWAGWDVRQRSQVFAALDEELEDREAPLEVRCGVLQGLWAILPDLEREHPAAAGEYRALAQSACNQTACPCPVLEAWRRRQAGGASEPALDVADEEPHDHQVAGDDDDA
ncbi:MAG: hypothetical protein KIT58_11665, partial [Planctomycetota bacterium]|nr:hypothetical protein [Planctomycetota bacterium]